MNGKQRYQQATTKARILSNRNLRKFLADEIDWLPMAKDREFIISEFDRLHAEIGRLRAIVRIKLMRSCGATHAEIDRILDEGPEVTSHHQSPQG